MGDRSHPRRVGIVGDPPLPHGDEIANEAPKSSETFDPTRDGFGFKNPLGMAPKRDPNGGKTFLRRLDPFLYGNGLCLGMAAAALLGFSKNPNAEGANAEGANAGRLSELPLSPEILDELFVLHARQFRPKAILAVVLDWLKNGGGKPDGVPRRIRLPEGGDPHGDPHILCFGPRMNRGFFRCMRHAHAVVPYRIENAPDESRVFVYDPNYPKSRSRYVSFGRDGGFRYGGFSSEGGWGITLLPLSAISPIGGRPI
ncbi:MAG: hypothetical protein H0V75_11780 [Rubrobacter sp.]|nr:hypothetical protein [Rubrobacter sp.]